MSLNTIKFLARAGRSRLTRDRNKLKCQNSVNGKIVDSSKYRTISFDDYRRIMNPPLFFVDDSDFLDHEIETSGRLVKFKVAETSHGIYVKPQQRVCCATFESRFGFGLGCTGFDPNRAVYYPSYR